MTYNKYMDQTGIWTGKKGKNVKTPKTKKERKLAEESAARKAHLKRLMNKASHGW